MNTGVLVIGVNGLIGSSLAELAQRDGIDWIGTSRKAKADADAIKELDLLNDDQIRNLSFRPKITYLCAAETNIRTCQSNPEATGKINIEQTVKLAKHLHQAGSAIVFLSSNLVFDGNHPHVRPEQMTAPQTEYGRQKAEAEKILLGELERVAVVRLTKVVHQDFALFKEWLSALCQRRAIRPFSDMPFCPIELSVVAEELWVLSRDFTPGIFQLSGDADLSYASAAQFLAHCRGIDLELVKPQTTAEAGFSQYFPRHTTLLHRPVRTGQEPIPVFTTLERIFGSLQL